MLCLGADNAYICASKWRLQQESEGTWCCKKLVVAPRYGKLEMQCVVQF